MILVRAPLRISFVGGGTDLPAFYHQYPGMVISATINKFVYLTINPSDYHSDDIIVKYKKTEIVSKPQDLQHDRFRAALIGAGITKGGLEISSLSDLPAGTGLGSSSSFTCAIIKGLSALKKKTLSKKALAEAACRLEIDTLREPIGKQDQYATAYGGLNIIKFNPDESVSVSPLNLSVHDWQKFKSHLLLFYTGLTREATSVLDDQQKKINDNLDTYKKMSDSVLTFKKNLLQKNYQKLGEMLHQGWLQKKSLSNKISSQGIDKMYQIARNNGAWGGKILGAGGGGCLLIMAKPQKHTAIKKVLLKNASKNGFPGFREIDFSFTQAKTEILFNDHKDR